MFDIKCPNCERKLQLPAEGVVGECQCPHCRVVFVPAGSPELRSRMKATTEDLSDPAFDAREPNDIDPGDRELEILAERRRFLREIEEDHAEIFADENRWRQRKQAAVIGFFIGLGTGGATLFFHSSRNGFSGFIGGILLDAAAGAIIGFLFTRFQQSDKLRGPAWAPFVSLALFAICVAGLAVFQWKVESRVDPYSLLGAAGIGAVVMFFSWILLLLLALLLRIPHR